MTEPFGAAASVRLSARQLHVLRHATGWDSIKSAQKTRVRGLSDLPRNTYFVSDRGDSWPAAQGLLEMALVTSTRDPDEMLTRYAVTERGLHVLMLFTGWPMPVPAGGAV